MKIYKKITISFIISIFLSVFLIINSKAQSCLNNFTYYLNLGSTDAETNGEVSRLQAYLYSINLLNTPPTGYFGELTRTAVAKYQISMNITPYGSVGPITRTALSLSCSINQNNDSQSNPNNQSSNNISNPIQPFATIDTNLSCIESPYDYKIGSKDMALFGEITKLQTFMYQNDLMSYPPTGYFGNLTEEGLLKYQNLRKLPSTGIYDFPTRITLAKETCGGKTSLTPPVIYGNASNTLPSSTNG